ncbi:MAG: mechanosensitive ion channel domain-containing protein [Pseudomonadota bacterium]
MEQDDTADIEAQIVGFSETVLAWVTGLVEAALRPWVAYQLGIAIGLFILAHLLRAILGPKMHAWMRAREGWPTWRMRILVALHQRLRAIIFLVLIGLTVTIMREITWPSRSQVLGIIGNLALAWLIVALATRLIRNGMIRQIVQYGAWAWITLRILNLTEDTAAFLDGIALSMGDMRLSVWLVIQAIFTLGILFFVANLASRTASARIQDAKDMSPSMRVLLVKLVQIGLFGLAILIGLRAAGIDLTGLAVLSGAIGVGLGFGLQKVVSNLVSGFIILLDKSIKPGDVISIGDTFGWIQSLGARYVSITTRDGREYLIPNEDLITGQVVNWSHSNDLVRLDIHFGTAYDDDPHAVRQIAVDAAKCCDRVLNTKDPVCHIVGFGDSSVDYILRFWIKDPTGGLTNIRGNVYLALWDAFKANGISIPFPQREVKILEQPRSPNAN